MIKEFGFTPAVEAEQYTINGLIEAILSHEESARE
jgi:uroporphyrinogen-III synthase